MLSKKLRKWSIFAEEFDYLLIKFRMKAQRVIMLEYAMCCEHLLIYEK